MQTPSAAWTTASQLTKTQGRLSGSYQPIVLLERHGTYLCGW